MLEDSHGNLWFGTGGGGASMYDGEYLYASYPGDRGLSR